MNSYYSAKVIQYTQAGNYDGAYVNALKAFNYFADTSRDTLLTSTSVYFDNTAKFGFTDEQDIKMADLYIKELKKLSNKYPENALIYAIQARYLGLKGGGKALEEAVIAVNKAIEISPQYVDFLSMKSALYLLQG